MSNSRLIISDLLDQLSFALCIVRKDYVIVKANEYFKLHAIHSAPSVEEHSILELFPIVSSHLKSLIDSVLNDGCSRFSSWEKLAHALPFKRDRAVYGEADKMYQDWEAIPVCDVDGAVEHICICIYDSTVQASQEKQLHLVMEQLNAERKQRQVLEQKLSEVQGKLIQSEKMASIGQISTGIAHEINNPIGSISTNIQTLNNYYQQLAISVSALKQAVVVHGDEALIAKCDAVMNDNQIDLNVQDANNLINESLQGSARIIAIINNLKEFSHVDGSEWSYTSLENCIESTIKIINNEIKYNVSIERDYQEEVPNIFCQPMQINQVLLNLLMNASQAIEGEGIIKVSLNKIDANSVEIRVKDNGPGISAELQERVFEPFFTTKGIGSGTGLGLSVSNDIIKMHHGKIRLLSDVGFGTEFIITLPIMKQS